MDLQVPGSFWNVQVLTRASLPDELTIAAPATKSNFNTLTTQEVARDCGARMLFDRFCQTSSSPQRADCMTENATRADACPHIARKTPQNGPWKQTRNLPKHSAARWHAAPHKLRFTHRHNQNIFAQSRQIAHSQPSPTAQPYSHVVDGCERLRTLPQQVASTTFTPILRLINRNRSLRIWEKRTVGQIVWREGTGFPCLQVTLPFQACLTIEQMVVASAYGKYFQSCMF